MKKNIHILIILIFISVGLKGQEFIDQIIMDSGDTILCKITLVNTQNIFYTYKSKRSEKYDHVLIKSVNNYIWASKNKKNNHVPEKYLHPYDSINKWNFGIKLTQQFNYPYLHTSPSLSIYRKNHNFHVGPKYTKLLKKYLSDPEDNFQQEYWGINLGYRYIFNAPWKKTNLFLQMDFSIYQLKYTEASLANPQGTKKKYIIVENVVGIGLNYQILDRFEIFGGIGFGSTNGFFLMFDQFIPHSFLGIEYKIKK